MRVFVLFVFSLCAQLSLANTCGGGKIERILAGGWESDDLIIQIDYSEDASAHMGTEYQGQYVRVRRDRVPNRFEFMQSIALAAYISGTPVRLYSHLNNCSDATQIDFWY